MFPQQPIPIGLHRLNVAIGPQNGPPLLLIHGATGRWQGWLPVAEQLAASHTLIMPDLPGHGGSDHMPDHYAVTHMARLLTNMLHHLSISSFAMIGHSYGGHVALTLSQQSNLTCTALVLEEIPLVLHRRQITPRPAGPNFQTLHTLKDKSHSPQAIKTRLARLQSFATPADLTNRLESLLPLDIRFLDQYLSGDAFAGYTPHILLNGLTCPTLLLNGIEDLGARLPADAAQTATSLSPHITHYHLPQAGHVLHAEQPSNFLKTLKYWDQIKN